MKIISSYLLLFMACLAFTSTRGSPTENQIPLSQMDQDSQTVAQVISGSISLHHIHIHYSDAISANKSQLLLQCLSSPDGPSDLVREVTVEGEACFGDWNLLTEVFNKLSSVGNVYWDVEKAIPKEILRSLENRAPLPNLYYKPNFRDYDPGSSHVRLIGGREARLPLLSDDEAPIIGSMVLYSLDAQIHYGPYPNTRDLDLVFRILSKSQNLRELKLSLGRSGCVVSGGQPYSFDFQSHPDVRFPPLEVLSLQGYKFEDDSSEKWDFLPMPTWHEKRRRRQIWPLNMLPELVLDGIDEVWDVYDFTKRDIISYRRKQQRKKLPERRSGMEWWLDVMDWSHIHTLDLGDGVGAHDMERLGRESLPSLVNLTLRSPGCHHAAIDFISNLSYPLEALSLQNMDLCSLELVSIALTKLHSQTLCSLAIHQQESSRGEDTAPLTFNKNTLLELITACPQLQMLDIDQSRSNSTNGLAVVTHSEHFWTETLDILATAKNLTHAILHYPSLDVALGDDNMLSFPERSGGDAVEDFLLNQNIIRSLFQTLRSKKQGKTLEKLEIHVGYQGPIWSCEVNMQGEELCEND